MKTPRGFRFAGYAAGIKPSRKDVALVVSDAPCAAAACFTANKAKAAPILEAEGRVPAADIRAVIVNSGNANALTGAAGVEDVRQVLGAVAAGLKVAPAQVLSASTGVIGVRLPVSKIVAAVPGLVQNLREEPDAAAEAMMTTDTRMKVAWREIELGGERVTLTGLCKGSGMIAPQLATMIAVIVTDCDIRPGVLQGAVREAMGSTFNSLTVDNDMSTNDTVFALANGLARNAPISDPGPELQRFQDALTDLCRELAKDIAADGEGATKLLEVRVTHAPTFEIAHDIAKSIAGSSLVKAAMFGADPNWGRILATVGARAGSQRFPVDPYRAEVRIQGLAVYRGEPVAHDKDQLKGLMREPKVQVDVALGSGAASATAWGCDLSYDYVKINADYTSLIVQKPDGGVAKDDRLANYSPSFKVALLVEALAYISRFAGKRCVIKVGGEALVKEPLKRALCHDVSLLRSVGLLPVVVHGGGPEITRTLEKLGSRPEMIDGVPLTDASDSKVVEMVLTGAVNTELVTLVNQNGNQAVGVSGKDGALLRAKKLIPAGGRDLGLIGEVTAVNRGLLDVLLGQGYVPIISSVGLGDDGQSYHLDADAVAAAVAVALGASKLIYLANAPGVLEGAELVNDLKSAELARRLESGSVQGGMRRKCEAALKALAQGVERVHVLDGRTPHSVIAELFTNRGVGTLVVA